MDEKLLETESGLIGTETIGQKEEKIRYKWRKQGAPRKSRARYEATGVL